MSSAARQKHRPRSEPGDLQHDERRATVCVALYSFDIGGSEVLGVRLAARYLRFGFKVVCCCTRRASGPLVAELDKLEVPWLALDLDRRGRFSKLLAKLSLHTWLRKYDVDLMHVHHFSVLSDCYLSARLAGARSLLVTEHTATPILHDEQYRRVTARLAPKVAEIVAINSVVQSAISEVSARPRDNIRVIENGVDTERFAPSASERASDCVNLLWVGRLHPDKNVLLALEAFRAVIAATDRTARLTIVGDGEDRSAAEDYVRGNGLDAVVDIVGQLEDVSQLMSAADIYVLSSDTEGTPFAMLEAMSSGLPVVATAVGGIPSAVDEGMAILVPPGDKDALADAMLSLVADGSARRAMGARSRQRACRDYSEERMAKSYLDLVQAMLDRHA